MNRKVVSIYFSYLVGLPTIGC